MVRRSSDSARTTAAIGWPLRRRVARISTHLSGYLARISSIVSSWASSDMFASTRSPFDLKSAPQCVQYQLSGATLPSQHEQKLFSSLLIGVHKFEIRPGFDYARITLL